MNKIINIIVVSFLFSGLLNDFRLSSNRSNANNDSEANFPQSNGFIDIESNAYEHIWVTTGDGLGKINYSMGYYDPETIIFSGVNSPNIPNGGNPALFIKDTIIIVSGVEQEYINGAYEPKGTGIGYSIDSGESWEYMPQPICEECSGYYDFVWGEQEITSLAVTTDINNVSYDVGLQGEYIYAASWAGGLRRFRYNDINPIWEVVPLPMDSQDSLICNSIDVESYLLNPRDPDDGGSHNHKGFSVFNSAEYLWVGTAEGINRGTINGGCIDWYHQTTQNGLSGNWVVGIENQITDDINRIWAITWGTEAGEYNSISYTEDHGVTWNDIEYFSSQNIKIFKLDFNGDHIYAASEGGLFYSEDLVHWEKVDRLWQDSSSGEYISSKTVYSVLFNSSSIFSDNEHILVGTGDGLVVRLNDENNVFRFFNSPTSASDNLGFSVYPNPYYVGQGGLVRFVYYDDNISSSNTGKIDIYDFTMNHVISLTSNINSNNADVIIWDGKNSNGQRVVNGTYFCKLSNKGNIYWTKLIVIN